MQQFNHRSPNLSCESFNREKFRLTFTANGSLKFGISLEEYLKCIPNHNELVLAPFNPIPIILQKAVPGRV